MKNPGEEFVNEALRPLAREVGNDLVEVKRTTTKVIGMATSKPTKGLVKTLGGAGSAVAKAILPRSRVPEPDDELLDEGRKKKKKKKY